VKISFVASRRIGIKKIKQTPKEQDEMRGLDHIKDGE